MQQKTRAYIYRVLTAVGPILTFHGFATDQAVSLYLALGATILGVGVAAKHTPTKDQ